MILASQSPRRIELMREAGYDVRILPADVNEAPLPGEDPFSLVDRLACTKAATALRAHAEPSEVVLAADTIVTIDRHRPRQARGCRGCARHAPPPLRAHHTVATGVCIAQCAEDTPRCLGDEPPISFVAKTSVTFYELSDEEIDAYIATGEPMDKAGAYGIQGAGGRMLVRGIEGDFYNVVGLPIAEVVRRLRTL